MENKSIKGKNSMSCYIFAASEAKNIRSGARPAFNKNFIPEASDIIIAADAGYIHALSLGVRPDIIVGDFDSLDYIPDCGAELLRFPKEKDDTDLMLAIKCGITRGFSRFVIYGALGGKTDFTLANFQILACMARKSIDTYYIGNGCIATAVCAGKISFGENFSGRISILCAGADANGVTIKGLKYTLENAALTSYYPLGISNEFIGSSGFIEVKDGTLLIIYDDINDAMVKESLFIKKHDGDCS